MKGPIKLKLKKRSSGEPEPVLKETSKDKNGRKPVVVYIMILFIVAFILMAISFVMHQRNNTEAIGKLQNSVSSLQEVQKAEDKNLKLQKQLKDIKNENKALQKELNTANNEKKSATNRAAALMALYTLQQQYSSQNFSACKKTISEMEKEGLDKLLPADSQENVTSPAQRYLQFREAIKNK